LVASPDGKTLYIEWLTKENTTSTGVFDGTTYRRIKEVPSLHPSKWMCFSGDEKKLYDPWIDVISVFSIPDYQIIGHIDLKQRVGQKDSSSKKIVDVAACKAVVLENIKKPARTESTAYVYDIETDKVIFEMPLHPTAGDYTFIPSRAELLSDESQLVPRILPDGTTEGKRRERMGKLHIYDMKAREEKAVLNVPEDGKHLWLSPDETTVYYLSPRRLSVIDLTKRKLIRTVEVPFTDAQLVFLRER
jgi:hypothetical protein